MAPVKTWDAGDITDHPRPPSPQEGLAARPAPQQPARWRASCNSELGHRPIRCRRQRIPLASRPRVPAASRAGLSCRQAPGDLVSRQRLLVGQRERAGCEAISFRHPRSPVDHQLVTRLRVGPKRHRRHSKLERRRTKEGILIRRECVRIVCIKTGSTPT